MGQPQTRSFKPSSSPDERKASFQGKALEALSAASKKEDSYGITFTTYKLIILYMLQNSEGDLTNSQITDFILDRKYTNYFQLQQAVSELVEADLVEMSSQSNRTYYRLTEEGKKNTLKYFSRELSSDIKKEVEEYLNSLHCKIEEHLLTPADYYPTKEGSYSVRLRIIEGGVSIVDLSIKVPNLLCGPVRM